MKCHIIYTTPQGFQHAEVDLPSLDAAEEWAKEHGATDWEIGVPEWTCPYCGTEVSEVDWNKEDYGSQIIDVPVAWSCETPGCVNYYSPADEESGSLEELDDLPDDFV